MEYKILENVYWENLVTEVNNYIKEGWSPQGGICATQIGSSSGGCCGYLYYQAIIKEDKLAFCGIQ